jgi:hypothetical protein
MSNGEICERKMSKEKCRKENHVKARFNNNEISAKKLLNSLGLLIGGHKK